MGLIDKITQTPLGLKGQTPAKLAGATAKGDLHYDPKTQGHKAGHTSLEILGTTVKYTDNLPK